MDASGVIKVADFGLSEDISSSYIQHTFNKCIIIRPHTN